VAGCGDKGLDKPLPTVPKTVQVKLPWRDGAVIPRVYTCDGADRTPAVSTPAGNSAVVMTDPDAPGGTFVHWTRWDGHQGKNSFGKTGYSGPCPPKGDKPHHYVVTVYRLRRALDLSDGADPSEVVSAIRKAAVASGSATGTYGR
jgi:phosphatidylethanolamine-binding protein (PEBP) family uncharacterized protein